MSKAPNTFDLEQQILQCWNVVDDIKMIEEYRSENNMSEDELANAMLGLHTLYQLKFQVLFSTFEKCLKDRKLG